MIMSRPDPSVAVRALKSAAPYIRMYKNKVFVIKAGGAVFSDEISTRALIEQVAILHQVGIKTVLVHGGGPQLDSLQATLGIDTRMVNGRRVTDQKSIDVTAMVLNGLINTRILAICRELDIEAIGLSGVDAGLIRAHKRPPVRVAEGSERDRGLRIRGQYRFGQHGGHREAARERLDAGGQSFVGGLERHTAQHQRRHGGRGHRRRAVGGETRAVHRRAGNSRARRGYELGGFVYGHQGLEASARPGFAEGRHAAQGGRNRERDPRRRATGACHQLQIRR